MISSMMTKVAIAPQMQIKDLFVDEILELTPNPTKAQDTANDLLKNILDLCSLDARIKLLKMFIGLGEAQALTQPVSQGLVDII